MNIDALKDIQVKKSLTDQQFADKLGIHRTSWLRVKSGRAPISDKFLVRVHRAFPELGIFLSRNATNDGDIVTQNSPDKPPSKNLRCLLSKTVGFLTGRSKKPVN